MNRITLIQEFFQKTDFQRYLEIGCRTGHSFLPVKARFKTAVDPEFKIPIGRKLKWLFKEPNNFYNKYFDEESDVFFLKRKAHLEKLGKLDVALVDGLHTFRNSLNDVLNTLKYLNDQGVIVMHDCLPPHKAAAMPTKYFPTTQEQESAEGWSGEWCGDVWKTIVYLRKNLSESVDVCVLDTDYGLGIVRPKAGIAESDLQLNEASFSEIDQLTYEEMLPNVEEMLNLKDAGYAEEIISWVAGNNK